MIKIFLLMILLLDQSYAKYLTNESCKECHEKIYEEFQSSSHSKTYFNDDLHRKVADKVSKEKYDCAVCHMPMASNLKDLVVGKARPDKNNKTHTDAISCYFCHTIAYVKKTHKYFDNVKAKQADGFKPTLYGSLENVDSTDKHTGVNSPIYAKNACKGCHSFKKNDYNTTIFRAMDDKQDSLECIKCHMPKVLGGNEKINKKARKDHLSHKFLGIRSESFRRSGIAITINIDKNQLEVKLKNKMAHPLIIQAARAKYFKITQTRSDKVIWQNYKVHPRDDAQAYFSYSFKKDGKKVIIPATATSSEVNNIEAKSEKTLTYTLSDLKKGDKIEVVLYGKLAKDDCQKVLDLNDTSFTKEMLITQKSYEYN
jgi:hypothetical protein